MKSIIDKFFLLSPEQRRSVHFVLCEYALDKWNAYAKTQASMTYVDSVIGTKQQVDWELPYDALESIKRITDYEEIEERYLEPITAMHEDDLIFPENIEYAYYAIYNFFNKYALNNKIEDVLILNQALSSEEDNAKCTAILLNAIETTLEK